MIETELERLREQFSGIAKGVVAENADATDSERVWPHAAFEQLKADKLTGLNVPAEWGGLGQGLLGLTLACETLGRECASTAICFGMHCVGTAVIAANATQDQGERFLRPIARGEHLTTLSLSEPGTGAHFYFPQTALEMDGDHYRVNGQKTFVTNGSHADSYVLSGLEVRNGDASDEFSCLILENNATGMEWQGPWQGLGMRGNSSIGLKLENVEVPVGNLLGRVGDQIWYVFNVVAPYFLTAMAGSYLGIAGAAVDEAVAHVKKRSYDHSGTNLAQAEVLQHRLGVLWARVERTRQLVYSAAERFDAHSPDALPAILAAKAEVADCAVNTVNDVMTVCGGIAYREGSRLHRMLRDARAAHVMAPTTDMLRIWTGRVLLEQPLLGD